MEYSPPYKETILNIKNTSMTFKIDEFDMGNNFFVWKNWQSSRWIKILNVKVCKDKKIIIPYVIKWW